MRCLIAGSLTLVAFLLTGCGGGNNLVSSVVSGSSATVHSVSRSTILFPTGSTPRQGIFLGGQHLVYSTPFTVTGGGFNNDGGLSGSLPVSRYTLYFAEYPSIQSDLGGSATELSTTLAVPVELTLALELDKPHRLVVFDRLNQREVPFSPSSAANVRIAFGDPAPQ